MAMRTQSNPLRIIQMRAHLLKHRAIFVRHRVTDGVRQVQHGSPRIHRHLAYLAQKPNIRPPRILRRKLHFPHAVPSQPNHRPNRVQRLLPRHIQFHAQVQIRSRQKNVQPRSRRRFQSLNGSLHILLLSASQSRNRHAPDFPRHLLHCLQITARRNREPRFNDVHAQRRKLPRHANLLLSIHREARRLLAVAQGRIKDSYRVHRGPPIGSRTEACLTVKFIFVLLLIILAYTTVAQALLPVLSVRKPCSTRRSGSMDLGELQVFLMVAKEGSFSRAAERLYRTQPAVSLTIRKLEDGLGQPLFVRGARPVRLTDAGTLLQDYAERLINLRDEVKKGLSELEGLNRGELSLDR